MNKKIRQLRIAKVLEQTHIMEEHGNLTTYPKPKYLCVAHQDCPNTMVEIWPTGNYARRAIGFSKVNWPDEFDPDYGIELAMAKAAAKLVKLHYDDFGAEVFREIAEREEEVKLPPAEALSPA